MNEDTQLKYAKELNLTYQKKVMAEVREICHPIFDFFGVTFFSHARAFHHGAFTCLLTHTDLTEYYLKKKYPINFSDGRGFYLDNGFYIAAHLANDYSANIRKVLREKFNVDHFIYLVEKHQHYDDFYALATTPENTGIINRYIAHRPLLQHFMLYYKDQSAALLKKADTIIYGEEYFIPPAPINQRFNSDDRKCSDVYLKKLQVNKIQLVCQSGEVVISGQEYECLKYIVKNYTLKEIGKFLQLSPRTVETYINNLKNKLHCVNRSQLVELVALNPSIPF